MDEGNWTKELLAFDDVDACQFSIENNWDFRSLGICEEFLALIDELKSRMTHVNNVMWHDFGDKIEHIRREEENTFLWVARAAFDKQQQRVQYATLEHPSWALSWETQSWSSMQGYFDGFLDRCRTSLGVYRNGALLGLRWKPTRIRSTSAYIAEKMSLECQCEDPHIQRHGKPLRYSKNYEPKMAKLLANAIVHVARRKAESEAHLAQKDTDELEMVEHKELLHELRGRCSEAAIREVVLPHGQLEHPSPPLLAKGRMEQGKEKRRCGVCKGLPMWPLLGAEAPAYAHDSSPDICDQFQRRSGHRHLSPASA